MTQTVSCCHCGLVTGSVTAASLSRLLTDVARSRQSPDSRCQLLTSGGRFLLRVSSVDEGFESDDEIPLSPLNVSFDDGFSGGHSHFKLEAKRSSEDSSSSANSSCSENDEAVSQTLLSAVTACNTIDGTDVVFCHSDPDVPHCIALVVRKWSDDRSSSKLESLVLKFPNENEAKNVLSRYQEHRRQRRWERYNRPKMNLGELSSFSDVGKMAALKISEPEIALARESSPDEIEHGKIVAYSEDAVDRSSFDEHSHLDISSKVFKKDISKSNGDEITSHVKALEHDSYCKTFGRDVFEEKSADDTAVANSNDVPIGADHRKQTKNTPKVVLVPTKSGLGPYRVIRGADFPRPSTPLMHVELPASWPNICQFDTSSRASSSRHAPRIVWTPVHIMPEQTAARPPLQRRSQSRLGSLDLPAAIGHALREIGGAVSSHLRRHDPAGVAVPAGGVRGVAPKSVMKKSARGAVYGKKVTFSAFSTLQVMD